MGDESGCWSPFPLGMTFQAPTQRPWSPIPIVELGEPLEPIPSFLARLEPHPYGALGAPYGAGADPFRLRSGVVRQLLVAEQHLAVLRPGWRLLIFDAWRPLAVQRFMVEQAIGEQCRLRGVDPQVPSGALAAIVAEVGRFWASPSEDPATPPPHSTGAAVDLTLAGPEDPAGMGAPGPLQQLDLGAPIDAIGAVSEPGHFAAAALADPSGAAARWHGRRQLLRQVMEMAGFAQHPNEWWHFSLGDQLWAWRTGAQAARYGRWIGDGTV